VILGHPSWVREDQESPSHAPKAVLQPQTRDNDPPPLSDAPRRSITSQTRCPPAWLSHCCWGNGEVQVEVPKDQTPKLCSTLNPTTAPFAGDVQTRRMQDLTFSRVLRVHLKLKSCSSEEKYHNHFISTAQPTISFMTGWPKYCEVLHPGKTRRNSVRLQANKQDIESISGTPNANQTDEDNAFLQTSKERETTQRPEYTNKARKKKNYIIKLNI